MVKHADPSIGRPLGHGKRVVGAGIIHNDKTIDPFRNAA
jgi:hypothetical protein